MGNWFFTVALAIGVVLIFAVGLLVRRYGGFILEQFLNFIGLFFKAFVLLILATDKIKKLWAKMGTKTKQGN